LIDSDNNRPLSLFPKHFGHRTTSARSGSPIDEPYVISRLVGSKLFEIDAPAAYFGEVQAGNPGNRARVGDVGEGLRRLPLY
jgi:hypothetical protein